MQPGDKVFLMRNGEIVEDTIRHVLLTENETLLSFNNRWTPTSARPPEWVKECKVFITLPQLLVHLEENFKGKLENAKKVYDESKDYSDDDLDDDGDYEDDLPSRKKGTPKTH